MLNLGKILNKKSVFIFAIILVLAVGGFFLWQNQKDVRELNKNLPKGVKVVKSLIGNKYKVVNKIDGYEFKVPEEWRGIKKMLYRDVTMDVEFNIRERIAQDLGRQIVAESHLFIEGVKLLLDSNMEIRVVKYSKDINLAEFVEQFKEIYTPYRKTARLEFFPQIDNFTAGQLKGFKLYTTIRSQHGSEIIDSDQYYFFNTSSKIYIFMHSDDEFVKEFINHGKW